MLIRAKKLETLDYSIRISKINIIVILFDQTSFQTSILNALITIISLIIITDSAAILIDLQDLILRTQILIVDSLSPIIALIKIIIIFYSRKSHRFSIVKCLRNVSNCKLLAKKIV